MPNAPAGERAVVFGQFVGAGLRISEALLQDFTRAMKVVVVALANLFDQAYRSRRIIGRGQPVQQAPVAFDIATQAIEFI